ncbi:MAG TPA: PorT family protein [Saprospiraceae bacterium]|nr:PorT family protein [Saprospiraceae bacterium]
MSRSGQAQSFHFGLKGGVDLVTAYSKASNNISFELGHDQSPILSYNANFVMEYHGVGKIGFTVEPGFIRKGYGFPNFSSEGIHKVYLSYIQVPVLMDYYMSDKFAVSAGMDLGIFVNHLSNDFYENFELSALIGCKYKLSEHFDLGLRYGHGVTPSFKFHFTNANGNTVGQIRDFNQYLQLSIAYIL